MKHCVTFAFLLITPIHGLAIDLALQTSFDSNLVNSPEGNEQLTASVVEAQVSDKFNLVEKPKSVWAAIASANIKVPYDYDALSTVGADTGLSYQWQAKPGFRSPWYSANTSVGIEFGQYDNQRLVDLSVSLFRNQRLTDKLYIIEGLQYRQRWGEESPVNGGLASAMVVIDWAISPSTALYAQPALGYGHFQSTYHGVLASANTADVGRSHHIPNEGAEENAPSGEYYLNDGLTESLNEDWYSYGEDAALARVMFGFNRRLTQKISFDTAYQYTLVKSDALSYTKHQFFVNLYLHW